MNRLMRFSGVTEESFPSILRRGWVCTLKGRFVDLPDKRIRVKHTVGYSYAKSIRV